MNVNSLKNQLLKQNAKISLSHNIKEIEDTKLSPPLSKILNTFNPYNRSN